VHCLFIRDMAPVHLCYFSLSLPFGLGRFYARDSVSSLPSLPFPAFLLSCAAAALPHAPTAAGEGRCTCRCYTLFMRYCILDGEHACHLPFLSHAGAAKTFCLLLAAAPYAYRPYLCCDARDVRAL